ncbi:hypothetical protein ACE6H2_019054 [Prunus campanulata]
MAESSSSGLTFKLHPLVIVNISDHYSRVKSQMHPPITNTATTTTTPPPNNGAEGAVETAPSSSSSSALASSPRVFGCVIGVQRGRTVEIFNSFELLYDPATHSLDRTFLEKKQELYKKVFPHFYILGWYSTGTDAQESDMNIHKAVIFVTFLIAYAYLMDINESPVYVLLNPLINPAQKDLPITIYESVAAHLTGIHSAIKMLNSRIRVLHHYLLAMQRGDIPCENSLLRQVSSLLRRLPAIESGKFQDDFLMEYNDTLLITSLAVLTNCSSTMNELVDKFNTAYDRHTRRGGRTTFF